MTKHGFKAHIVQRKNSIMRAFTLLTFIFFGLGGNTTEHDFTHNKKKEKDLGVKFGDKRSGFGRVLKKYKT